MLPPAGSHLAARLLSLERQQIKHENLDVQSYSEVFPIFIAHVSDLVVVFLRSLRLAIHNGYGVQRQILLQGFPVLGKSNIFCTLALFQHVDIAVTT